MFMQLLLMLLNGMANGIKWLQSIEIIDGVSVWSFIIACIVVGVVISGLLNLVSRPPIGDAVSDAKSDRRRERMRRIRAKERERRKVK